MERFIHRENLALYRKRLAEPRTDAERGVLLKLLAEEEAKETPPKKRADTQTPPAFSPRRSDP
jgi:hypothetical protein